MFGDFVCYMYILKSEDNERKGISKKKKKGNKKRLPSATSLFFNAEQNLL